MSDSPPTGPAPAGAPPRPPQQSERSTVSRSAGLFIAAATAVVVFALGTSLWPSAAPPPVAAVALPDTFAVPSAPGTTADAGRSPGTSDGGVVTSLAGDSGQGEVGAAPATHDDATAVAIAPDAAAHSGDGDLPRSDSGLAEESGLSRREIRKRRHEAAAAAAAAASTGGDGGAARSPESPPSSRPDARRGSAPLPPADAAASTAGGQAQVQTDKEASAADCALPAKDLARESWRRNWPAVCSLGGSGRAFILMPIKGPLEGENHALHRHPAPEARINLAAGTESLLTMKQYKMNRLGFKELRVNTSEDGRSRLRVKLLPGAGDPVFEIKDGYAKITVALPDRN